MKLRTFLFSGAVTTMIAFAACDKDDDNESTSAQDQTFVTQANMSNKAEIDLGTLATTKASNASTKAFGQMMITEHTNAQAKLVAIANSLNLSGNLKDSLSPANKALRDSLLTLSGRAFDTVYIKGQIRGHQLTATNMRTEISNGSNDKIKGYATENLPHVLMHLDSANAIYSRIK